MIELLTAMPLVLWMGVMIVIMCVFFSTEANGSEQEMYLNQQAERDETMKLLLQSHAHIRQRSSELLVQQFDKR